MSSASSSSSSSTSSSSSSSSSDSKIIILMLAHTGVTQPAFWSKWRSLSHDSSKIVFRVHAPKDPQYGKEFCNENSIGFYNENTDWCDANLVYVFLQCIESILKEFYNKNNKNNIIYFVSGFDIPIVPADALFGLIPFNKDNKPLPDPFSTKICYLEKEDNFDNNVNMQQWCALSLQDANALYTIMINDGIFNKLKKRWLVNMRIYKDIIACPDEYFISTAIIMNKEKWINAGGSGTTITNLIAGMRNCPVADTRISPGSLSPNTWNDHSPMSSAYGKNCYSLDLLYNILMYRKDDNINSSYFYRKIGPDIKLGEKIESLIYNIPSSVDNINPVYKNILELSKSPVYKIIKCVPPYVIPRYEMRIRPEIAAIYSLKDGSNDANIITIFDGSKKKV